MKKRQYGFGIIIVIPLVIIGILFGTWYVWQSQKSGKISDHTTENTKPVVDDYANWTKYCDDNQKFCFNYPADWSISQSGEEETFSVRVVNPSNSLSATYIRNDTRDGHVVPFYVKDIEDLAAPDARLKTISGFASRSENSKPYFILIGAKLLIDYPVVIGSESNFINTARFDQLNGEPASLSVSPIGKTFTTTEAKEWFTSQDAATARLIIRSVSFSEN